MALCRAGARTPGVVFGPAGRPGYGQGVPERVPRIKAHLLAEPAGVGRPLGVGTLDQIVGDLVALAGLGAVEVIGDLNPDAPRALEILWRCGPVLPLLSNSRATDFTKAFTNNLADWLKDLRQALAETGIPGRVNATGSLATLFFTEQPVRNYRDAKQSDTKRYARFFREMLDRGIFLAPSQFEAAFLSAAHTSEDISRTIAAARDSLKAIAVESTT